MSPPSPGEPPDLPSCPPARSVVAAVLVLLVMFGPSLADHARHSADPMWFNDDARQWLPPFYSRVDPELFRGDFVTTYYRALDPPGHACVYRALAPLVDPTTLGKVLPYGQLALLLAGVAAAAWTLAGTAGAGASLALTLSSSIFMDGMCGGLARSWGYPLVSLVLVALVRRCALSAALVTVLAAALYPPASVLSGTALALWLVVLPRSDRGRASSWSAARRLTLLTGTALVAAALVAPGVIARRAYGRPIGPADLAHYPEAGPGGRWAPQDRPPFPGVPVSISEQFGLTLQGDGPTWIPGLRFTVHDSLSDRRSWPLLAVTALVGVLTLAGTAFAARRDGAARRALALLAAAMIDYVAADLLQPALYIPQRYTYLAVPVLSVVMVPAAAREVALAWRASARRPWVPAAWLVAVTATVLVLLGGRGGTATGLTVHVDSDLAVYAHLASLPRDRLVAGWPAGLMDNVPYLCRRPALVTWETHQAFFTGYVLEMRRRMEALVAAYFATDEGPVRELARVHGVTHLVVDDRHFGPDAPGYFAPFDRSIQEAHGRARARGSYVLRLVAGPGVFRCGHVSVVELHR